MKTRLVIFVSALLLLPLAGLLLSGHEWNELAGNVLPASDNDMANLVTILVLLCYIIFVNIFIKRLTGNSLLGKQRSYFVAMGIMSTVLCWLLSYLNYFAASWSAERANSTAQILLVTMLFALLAPAVLVTRALLGSFPGLLKRLARGKSLPAPGREPVALTLMTLAMLGLLGGGAWPEKLFWLLWAAPLLLLLALQLLWHENTIFSGLKSGDWGRVICATLAGLLVGNLAAISYQAAGGRLIIESPSLLFTQFGYALFGLLSLQLSDIIAENWRGKQRSELFKQKKKFPIPVVVKKS